MAPRREIRVRWDPQEPDRPGPGSHPLHRPIVPSPQQPLQEVLLRRAGVPLGQVPDPDHLLLRRDQRPGFAACVRSDGRRDSLERGEHHGGLRQRHVLVLRRGFCRSGEDHERLYRGEHVYGFGPVYIGVGVSDGR